MSRVVWSMIVILGGICWLLAERAPEVRERQRVEQESHSVEVRVPASALRVLGYYPYHDRTWTFQRIQVEGRRLRYSTERRQGIPRDLMVMYPFRSGVGCESYDQVSLMIDGRGWTLAEPHPTYTTHEGRDVLLCRYWAQGPHN